MTPAVRRLLGNALAFGFGLLLCLPVGEGAARLYQALAPGSSKGATLHGTIGEYDALTGWRLLPGVRVDYSGPEFRTVIQTNSRRLRESEEIPYEKTAGGRRILLCGDSFTFGHGVDEGDRYGEGLALRIPGAEVVNMGIWGTGTDQQYLLYREEGTKYQPDLVILAYFVENITRNASATRAGAGGKISYKPRYVLRDGKLELTNVPVPQGSAERSGAGSAAPPPGGSGSSARARVSPSAWLRDHSALYRLVRTRVAGPLGRALGMTSNPYPQYAEGREEWEVTKAILRMFAAEAGARGSRFLVVVVPDIAYVYRARVNDRPAFMVEDYCRSAGIPVLNLLPGFRDAARGGNRSLYFRHDAHWTPAGHALAADLLAAYLRERGW